MISNFKIGDINENDFNYTIKYKGKNEFEIILNPSISLTKAYLLTINFYILRSIITDDTFYLSKDCVTLKLKPMEKLTNETLASI